MSLNMLGQSLPTIYTALDLTDYAGFALNTD